MDLALPKLIRDSGLTRRELVSRMGYRNTSKGFRNLDAWLRGAWRPRDGQVDRLAAALGVPPEEITRLVEADIAALWAERKRRRALDARYYLTTRFMAAIYGTEALPEGTTDEEAVEVARKWAASIPSTNAWCCCLQAPDSTIRYFYRNGAVSERFEATPPTSSVGGRPVDFSFLLR